MEWSLVTKAWGVLGWGLADDAESAFSSHIPTQDMLWIPQKKLLGHAYMQNDAATFLRLFAKDFCDVQCHIEYDRKCSSIIQQCFIEQLLCTKLYSKYQGNISEQDRKKPALRECILWRIIEWTRDITADIAKSFEQNSESLSVSHAES